MRRLPERFCTVCLERGEKRSATHVATNAEGGQWYECGQHGVGDHSKAFGGGFMRLRLQTMAEFFNFLLDEPEEPMEETERGTP